MKKLKNTISTGGIANYHGELYIMKKADKYYQGLEDFNSFTKKKKKKKRKLIGKKFLNTCMQLSTNLKMRVYKYL